MTAARACWDNERDTVVSVNINSERLNLSLQVFFIYIDDSDEMNAEDPCNDDRLYHDDARQGGICCKQNYAF